VGYARAETMTLRQKPLGRYREPFEEFHPRVDFNDSGMRTKLLRCYDVSCHKRRTDKVCAKGVIILLM
jgi:hypothetical protein